MKIICVTGRKLCKNNFFEQIEKICSWKIDAVVLREKDLNDGVYEEYAVKCRKICEKNNVKFFINTKIHIAEKLNIKNIQLSSKDFFDNKDKLNFFEIIAVSVHSVKEAIEVEKFYESCTCQSSCRFDCFLIAGHIFSTDCKKGLQPKGTDFLKSVCDNVKLPVFAIGGINNDTVKYLKNMNIKGVCIMSALMSAQKFEFKV